jgi:hypothetical protein
MTPRRFWLRYGFIAGGLLASWILVVHPSGPAVAGLVTLTALQGVLWTRTPLFRWRWGLVGNAGLAVTVASCGIGTCGTPVVAPLVALLAPSLLAEIAWWPIVGWGLAIGVTAAMAWRSHRLRPFRLALAIPVALGSLGILGALVGWWLGGGVVLRLVGG